MRTLTIKQENLYGAYAPAFNVSAWGSCEDEAVNNLTEQVRQRGSTPSTGEEERDEIRV
jgi:hypothetical protein